jgi:hypothetical protein
MTMRKILALILSLLWASPVAAQIVGALPFTLQNGSIADANQVMSDLNTIVAAVNANAASAGANNNITALNGLTTPLVYTSGGTSLYIGGTSSGSANAQVVASPIPSGFSLITGKSVVFTAGFTNTGPATLNVAGTGVVNVFHPGVAGAVALSGGEMTAGNLVTATFDGTQFQIPNVTPQSLVPPCTVIDWVGANGGPSGYLLMSGSTVSRATFAALFACITVQGVAATTTNGSGIITVPNSALFQIGWSVGGNNVTCNTTINTIPDGTHITTVAASGATGATTLTIGPFPQGDCSTTFTVGNFTGRATAMHDYGSAILTAANCPNPASIGTVCGSQTKTLATANLPNGPLVLSDTRVWNTRSSGGTNNTGRINTNTSSTGTNYDAVAINSGSAVNLDIQVASGSLTGTVGGSSTPLSSLPPMALVDKYIKY